MNRKVGFLCFLSASILYGAFGLLIRFLQNDFSSFQQIALRGLGSVIIASIWVFSSVERSEWKMFRNLKVLGFGLAFPVSVIFWTLGVTNGTVRSATFGLYLGSLLTSAFAGWQFFAEKLTKYNYASIGLALLAALVFCLPLSVSSEILPSICLGTLAGISQALNICYRRWLGGISRPIIILVQSLGGFGIGLIFSIIFFTSTPDFTPSSLLVGLIFGALVVAASYLLLVGAKNLEMSTSSIVLSTELIWATLMAALFLNEMPTTQQIIGCGILMIALLVARIKSTN